MAFGVLRSGGWFAIHAEPFMQCWPAVVSPELQGLGLMHGMHDSRNYSTQLGAGIMTGNEAEIGQAEIKCPSKSGALTCQGRQVDSLPLPKLDKGIDFELVSSSRQPLSKRKDLIYPPKRSMHSLFTSSALYGFEKTKKTFKRKIKENSTSIS